MKRSDVLNEAFECVCCTREKTYGTPEENFNTVGLLWAVYLRAAHPELAYKLPINGINAKDVAVMMSLFKVARIATGSSADNFIDLAGYAALAGEIATQQPEQKKQPDNENTCVVCGASIPEGGQYCKVHDNENGGIKHG